jgi:hypothetical protein
MKKKMEQIVEKLKDVLSAEDLDGIKTTISEMVKEKSDLIVEEETKRLETLAEQYCEEKVTTDLKTAKEALIEDYDKKLEDLETTIVEKVDRFIDLEISSKISDDTFKSIAINETYGPVIDGVMKVFAENYKPLSTVGPAKEVEGIKAKLDESVKKVGKLNSRVKELHEEKLELSELTEKAATRLLIKENTGSLTEGEQTRVNTFFEGKSFDEVEDKIGDFVEMITEQVTTGITKEDKEVLKETAESQDDGIEEPSTITESEEVEVEEDSYETVSIGGANRLL